MFMITFRTSAPLLPGSTAPRNMPPSCTSTKLVYSVQGAFDAMLFDPMVLCSISWSPFAVADPCAAQFPVSVCQQCEELNKQPAPAQRRTKMSVVSLAFGYASLYLPAWQLSVEVQFVLPSTS